MVVMQVDPDGQTDPTLQALADKAKRKLETLIEYVDVNPPKLSRAQIRTLQAAANLLTSIDTAPTEAYGANPRSQ